MNIKGIKVGDKVSKYPIIQGGMGIGVSGYRLAGTVAKEGGIGIISAANIGYEEPDFETNNLDANLRAIDKHIKKARQISPTGILGVNMMVAVNHYAEMAKQVVAKGIDLILSGAGLPKDLPQYVKGTKTKIAPIISSARGALLITKMWIKKYDYVPDMIIVEGPEAGGHLGFSSEELEESKRPKLENIVKEVIEGLKEIEEAIKVKIPVIAAGGIFDRKDVFKFLKLGAGGVQVATRFVTTEECDASDEFKQAYIDANKEDVKIIKSPVGMPGRAIRNKFIKEVEQENKKVIKCLNCIKTCDVATTPYCITRALINSVRGKVEEGLIFCGSNVDKIKEIISVRELMQELAGEN